MEKQLHIITDQIPLPNFLGRAHDSFYKIVSLTKNGIKIHLHCFYENEIASDYDLLNNICSSINFYEMQSGHKSVSSTLPHEVSKRKNEKLFKNLLENDYPILMEGIPCSNLLWDERFSSRKKFLRIQRVEQELCKEKKDFAPSLLDKLYLTRELSVTKKYELNIAQKATAYWGVTQHDVSFYRKELSCTTIDYLSPYIPNSWQLTAKEGKGLYCFYHGDLSNKANEYAATWLLEKVFNTLEIPFVIAGNNPSNKLFVLAYKHKHTCIVANPSEKEMQDMISKAHIHVLPSFTSTGIQRKLINALFNGRHCLVNSRMINNTRLDELCNIANTNDEFIKSIQLLFNQSFTNDLFVQRQNILLPMFNNDKNALQQIKWIWETDYNV